MKTKKEIKQWLLENAINEDGNLNLSELDFSDFDGDIYIGLMKVKHNLHQDGQKVQEDLNQGLQEVQGDLVQDFQEVQGSLYQDYQEVKGNLYQNFQKVEGYFLTQTLKDDEEYKIKKSGFNFIEKKEK